MKDTKDQMTNSKKDDMWSPGIASQENRQSSVVVGGDNRQTPDVVLVVSEGEGSSKAKKSEKGNQGIYNYTGIPACISISL